MSKCFVEKYLEGLIDEIMDAYVAMNVEFQIAKQQNK